MTLRSKAKSYNSPRCPALSASQSSRRTQNVKFFPSTSGRISKPSLWAVYRKVIYDRYYKWRTPLYRMFGNYEHRILQYPDCLVDKKTTKPTNDWTVQQQYNSTHVCRTTSLTLLWVNLYAVKNYRVFIHLFVCLFDCLYSITVKKRYKSVPKFLCMFFVFKHTV